MKKTILSIIVVAAVVGGVWYLISSGNFARNMEAGNAVALVNGEEISQADFETLKTQIVTQQGIDVASLDAEVQNQLDEQLIDELITQALLEQAVNASGIVAAQADVDAQVDATKAQFGDVTAFEQALVTEGMTEDEFRAQVGMSLATQTYLEQELKLSSVTATDEEVETTYAQAVAQNEDVPPLSEVRSQVEQSVIQQKQQELFALHIEELRQNAEIEILL